MKNLNISVANKVATYRQRDGEIVCGNSDYKITFTFDSEWDAYAEKMARFKWNGLYKDVALEGDTAQVPILENTERVEVGVYAGELCTTTPATIPCKKSILCDGGIELITEEDRGSIDGRINTLEALGQTLKNQIAQKKLYLNTIRIQFAYTSVNGNSTLANLPSGYVSFRYLGTDTTLAGTFPTNSSELQRVDSALKCSVGLRKAANEGEVTINGVKYPIRYISISRDGSRLQQIDIVTESWENNTYKSETLRCYSDGYGTTSGVSLRFSIQELSSMRIFT